jgi:two-component system chemotaxis response regulator CheY
MKTILLVNDEAETREMLANIIQRMGPKVVGASTGKEAIELYQETKPDCVFLDIKLPDIEGPQVLEKLKEIDLRLRYTLLLG